MRRLFPSKFSIIALGLFLALASGCGSATKPFKISSGRLEATIRTTDKGKVFDQLTREMLKRGYRVASSDENRTVFERESSSVFSRVLFGSFSSVLEQVTFTLVSTATAVRVLGEIYAISNPDSAFERRTNLINTRGYANELQNILIQTRAALTQKPRK